MFEFLKKWFWPKPEKQTELEGRIYHFPLPYRIEAVYLHYGLAMLRADGVFHKLPPDIQARWIKAADMWHPLKITREDLDRIDDDSWTRIASKLNLKWENSV